MSHKRLILSSRGLVTEELTNCFVQLVGRYKRIAIITTASPYKEQNKHAIALHQQLQKLGHTPHFVDIEYQSAATLSAFDVIILNGGNPYVLLHHLKKSGADTIIQAHIYKGLPVMGISAGAFVLMPDLAIVDALTPELNTIGLTDKSALNAIDAIVVPHYDRFVQEGKIDATVVDQFERTSGRTVIRLGEYQCLVERDGERRLIGLPFLNTS
ncbi:MAG: Type 1 glutamine amidotransferase-like domain-containing protein [Bacteroidota bacterium]